jgi:hypothetical protein
MLERIIQSPARNPSAGDLHFANTAASVIPSGREEWRGALKRFGDAEIF